MENLEKSGAISERVMSGTQGVEICEKMKISLEKELHLKFRKLGYDRRKLTNELLALLPEIYARGIYKKYAATIVEYAGKFGGLSKGVVIKRLRLEKTLEGKPKLKSLIVSEGVHKVALVAGLATSNNEEMWADKVENMSKEALFELAKEVRYKEKMRNEAVVDGLFEDVRGGGDEGEVKSEKRMVAESGSVLCLAAPQTMKITLEGDLLFLFLKLKKQFGKHLTSTELLYKIFTESLEANSRAAKRSVMNSSSNEKSFKKPKMATNSFPGKTFQKGQAKPKITHYNPVNIKREKLAETGGKCTYPGCNRPCENWHHTERIAEAKAQKLDRDTVQKSIIPMCKLHHEFAHNGLIQNEKLHRNNWGLLLSAEVLSWVDQNYRKWRKAGLSL